MKKEKGAITLYVMVVCLFILVIGASAYISVSNRQAMQLAALKKIEESYNNTSLDAEDLYKNYEGGDIVPVFTPEQFTMVGTGKTGYVPETGKIYTYTTDKTYMFYGQSEDLTEIINSIVEQKTNEVIESKNYVTVDNVNEIVENKNYVTDERLDEFENSIASIGFPDYANRTVLTAGVEYTADANMYVILDSLPNDGYGYSWVYLDIDGVKYSFAQGVSNMDYHHPTNAIFPIAKGSVFTITMKSNFSPTLYKVYAK